MRPSAIHIVTAVLLLGVGASVWGLTWAMEHASYDTVAGTLVGIVVGFAAAATGRLLSHREPDPLIARLLLVAPLLKVGMSVARYAVSFVVYEGYADSVTYHQEGLRLADSYGAGIFDADLGKPLVGAGSIRMLTGLLYTVTGPTQLGAYFVFSFVGFFGLYLFYRAFVVAVPDGDHRRYAFLLFLLPSLLFWPSALGKEAIMTLGLGASAYGAALILRRQRGGFPAVLVGLLAMGMVRPHVAAMVAVALTAAYLTRRQPRAASLTAPLAKLVGILILGALLVVSISQTKSLLGIDEFNADAIDAARSEVLGRTDDAESTFQTSDTDLNPSRFHVSVASVLFRPFPWEAENLQSALASLEGLALLGLLVAGWRRLLGGIRSVLHTPYVTLCITYTVLFTYGFASFSNFGILTRQRVQVLPFVLVLLALPPYHGRIRDARGLLLGESAASQV